MWWIKLKEIRLWIALLLPSSLVGIDQWVPIDLSIEIKLMLLIDIATVSLFAYFFTESRKEFARDLFSIKVATTHQRLKNIKNLSEDERRNLYRLEEERKRLKMNGYLESLLNQLLQKK